MRDYFEYEVQEYENGGVSGKGLSVITETGLLLNVNGQNLVTLACTGKNLEYLAAGFLYSCGLVNSSKDILELEISEQGGSFTAEVRLAGTASLPPRTITSGLGWNYRVEGRRLKTIARPEAPAWKPESIIRLASELKSGASLYHRTRGCHNSSLCDHDKIVFYREDIGRHNAIDTIVGECLLKNIDTSAFMLLSTGRIASEIVQKAARAGVGVFASTSMATSLAIDTARKAGLTLIGNITGSGFIIYNDNGQLAGL